MRALPATQLVFAPDGAPECSHGWSGAKAQPSPRNPWFTIHAFSPRRGEGTVDDAAGFRHTNGIAPRRQFLRPIRGGIIVLHSTGSAPLHPWLHSAAPSGAKARRILIPRTSRGSFWIPSEPTATVEQALGRVVILVAGV